MWQSIRMKRNWDEADEVTPGCSVEASPPPAHLSGCRLLLSFTHLLHHISRIFAQHNYMPSKYPDNPSADDLATALEASIQGKVVLITGR